MQLSKEDGHQRVQGEKVIFTEPNVENCLRHSTSEIISQSKFMVQPSPVMDQRRYCKAVLKNEKLEVRGPILDEIRTRQRAQLNMKGNLELVDEFYDRKRELIPSESLTSHRELKQVPSEQNKISATSNLYHNNSQSSFQDDRSFFYS